MKSRSVRSFVFAAAMFVFACLLLAGSPRLIGREAEAAQSAPVREICAVPAAITSSPAPRAENGCTAQSEQHVQRQAASVAPVRRAPVTLALSDANGNVLGCRSYIHEVYQAFTLSDGFA